MLTLRQLIGTPGPVIDNGECQLVCLPDGSVRECDGLSDADRIWEEWEQRGGERDEPNCGGR